MEIRQPGKAPAPSLFLFIFLFPNFGIVIANLTTSCQFLTAAENEGGVCFIINVCVCDCAKKEKRGIDTCVCVYESYNGVAAMNLI